MLILSLQAIFKHDFCHNPERLFLGTIAETRGKQCPCR
jgi:hypothetical protein